MLFEEFHVRFLVTLNNHFCQPQMNIEPAFEAASVADIIVTLATDGQHDPAETQIHRAHPGGRG